MKRLWSDRMGIPVILIALVIASGITVAACGNASTSDGGAGASASPAAAQGTQTDLYGPMANGEAAGDIEQLTVGMPTGEPGSINPWIAPFFGINAALVDSNLCDTLIRQAPDGTFVPGIASSWEYGNGNKTLTFTLREDVKFWDGSPLTSADVVYSLKSMSDPVIGAGWLYVFVESITADGPYTVTLHFSKPDELLFQEMATFAFGIVEKAWAEKVGLGKVGAPGVGLMASGPYRFKSWTPGEQIVLERNPDYWDPQYKAHAATVTLKFLPDSTALAQALESGEVDAAWALPSAVVPRLQKSTSGKLYFGDSSQFAAYTVMRPDGPLADVNIRKALALSLDRAALAKSVFNGAGRAWYTLVPSYAWYPEAEAAWQQAYQPIASEYAYNLDGAKKLVSDSSYGGEPIVCIIPAGDATLSAMAQYMQQQAKAIGLTMTIKPLQPIPFGNAMQSKDARKGYDLMLASQWMAARDPLEFWDLFRPSPWNFPEYSDPQVSALFEKARSTFDVNERTQLLTQAQAIYEPAQAYVGVVGLDLGSYLKSGLAGMVTDWHYFNIPAIALIGSAK
jgi:peptide/nickel transport system substrate-binding protein